MDGLRGLGWVCHHGLWNYRRRRQRDGLFDLVVSSLPFLVQPTFVFGEQSRLLFVDVDLAQNTVNPTDIDHGATGKLFQLAVVPTVGLVPFIARVLVAVERQLCQPTRFLVGGDRPFDLDIAQDATGQEQLSQRSVPAGPPTR